MVNKLSATAVTVALATLPSVAAAQGLDTLGTRAAGMSAFVAVADDASAVAWNPAGLVLGPLFNISVDLGRSSVAPDGAVAEDERAGKIGTSLIAIGVPPLGLSYYRIGTTFVEPIGAADQADVRREDRKVGVRTLVTSHLGATLLQSLGDHLTIGTTVKLVRGQVAADIVAVQSWDEGLDRADTLRTHGSTRGDLDVGAMFTAGRVRAGIVVRNVSEPTFVDENTPGADFTVKRHARAGVAWGDRWPGMSGTILALDADLTRVEHPSGERRDIAAGVERWLRSRQIGIRGGVRTSTLGRARAIATGGLSYAVRSGTYIDAYVSRGDRHARGWGIAGRMTY